MKNLEQQFSEVLSIAKTLNSVDTMIIETIALLDDGGKFEGLKKYAMRVRCWYGCHFPELSMIIRDDVLYAKSVKLMGNRINAAKLDFSEILESKVEVKLKKAALKSKGKEASDLELMRIQELCDKFLLISQLYDNLKTGMNNVAPNLTALVGELVGARMISHRGCLKNLAKLPASTIQILGSEKAMSRSRKRKHPTSKYGLIYCAPLVRQAKQKLKGKISRSLAAKAVLAIRIDALGDGQNKTMGVLNRAKLEARLRNLQASGLAKFKTKCKCEKVDDQLVKSPVGGDE